MSRPARFALLHPIVEGIATIDGAELHHLRDVMRLRAGAAITLLGRTTSSIWRTSRDSRRIASIVRIEKTLATDRTPPLILATAIIKGPRMDFMVEKAAELGVTELWPMLCERSVVKDPGAERIEQMAPVRDSRPRSKASRPRRCNSIEPMRFADLIESLAKETLADGAPRPRRSR